MEFKDYYKILGLQDSASAADIKKAYRSLARKYHPDVSSESDAEDRFKEVSEAYEVLKNPEKRKEYDQLRQMGAQGADGSFRPPPDWQSAAHYSNADFDPEHAAHFSDFFDQIFGQRGSAHRTYREGHQSSFQMRGEDIHQRLPLFLEEAFNGCEKHLKLSVPEVDGRGLISHRQKNLKVKIPAGMGNGQHLRLKGQGAPGIGGGPAGDLLIEIQLAPHPVYHVDGKDLLMQLPLAPWEAVLGSSVTLSAISGDVRLKIPADSNTGDKLKLRGKGMPGKPPGDLIVQLKVVLPDNNDEQTKALYRQLQETSTFDPRRELEGADQ